jgi:hypothetical protein
MSVSEMRDLLYVDKPGLRFAPSGLRLLSLMQAYAIIWTLAGMQVWRL